MVDVEFIGRVEDLDGSAASFSVDQPLASTTPTLYLLLDVLERGELANLNPASTRKIVIDDVKYRFQATNNETFQLYLLERTRADAVGRRSDVIYDSGVLRTRNTDYHETADGRVPSYGYLYQIPRLYYMIDWSGDPGTTPGFLTVRGRVLR